MVEWGTARAPTLFRRQTFHDLYTVPEKLISVDMAAGVEKLRVATTTISFSTTTPHGRSFHGMR